MPVSFALHTAGLAGLLALSLVVPEEPPAPTVPPVTDVGWLPTVGSRLPAPARHPAVARNPRGNRRAVTPVLEVPVDVPPIEPEAFAPDDDGDAGCTGCAPLDDATGGGGGDDRGTRDGMSGHGATGTSTDPVRVGGNIQPPRKIRHVDPAYPELAKRARVAAVVVLDCVIDREGLIRSVQVVSGHPLLNEAAVSAVRQWAYRPTLLNGVPVTVVMTVTVRFTTR